MRWSVLLALVACVPSREQLLLGVERDVRARSELTLSQPADRGIDDLLSHPLTLDAALRIALARNPSLRARFEALGVTASYIADATVLPPAEVDVDGKAGVGGAHGELELEIIQPVLDLLQLGQRRAVADAELHAAQTRAAAAVFALAANVEIAFVDLVAAQQSRELVATAFDSAAGAADLAERMRAAGNTSDLAVAREQEQRERARLDIDRADREVADRRAILAALLGVPTTATWAVAGPLPDIPEAAPGLDDLDDVAKASSLEATALRSEADAAATRHRYAVVRAVVPELGIGAAAAEREPGQWEVGPAVRVGVPLFDLQQGPRARALAQERTAVAEIVAEDNELSSAVARVKGHVAQAFREAHQLRDVVIPLRQRVLDQTVLHYNAMDATPFELLVARRDVVDGSRQYVEAVRSYWAAIAEVRALERGARVP
jgi:cobalt-zinc-cadmium efflux system outer membrane protein